MTCWKKTTAGQFPKIPSTHHSQLLRTGVDLRQVSLLTADFRHQPHDGLPARLGLELAAVQRFSQRGQSPAKHGVLFQDSVDLQKKKNMPVGNNSSYPPLKVYEIC